MAVALFRRFARRRTYRDPSERVRAAEDVIAAPRRPESPAAADDAELDALRGELVRELNRLAERSRGVD
jgi:hypothetical protein